MVIDGRIADVAETRVIDQQMIIPRFVLQELQSIADSSDKLRRNRGRRGLDILNRLQKSPGIEVRIHDAEIPELAGIREVDQKLVVLAKHLGGKVVTNDYNLNKIARLQGVEVINLNDLANAMKPIVLPGESLTVKLLKRGEEQGQGIGYLDDGTMVVAEQGAYHLGETLRLTVTSVLQTSAGRMIFGRIDPVQPPKQPAAAAPPQESQAPAQGRHHRRLMPGSPTGRERSARDLPDGLAQPLRVLDEGEAEKAFAGLAECPAGTDDHVGFFQQLHREFDRAHSRPPCFGHRRPDEHPRFRRLGRPAEALEASHQDVTTGLIFGHLGQPSGFPVPQGDDGCDLDCLEDAVVVVPLDRFERTQHVAVTGGETRRASRPCCSLSTWS